MTFRPLIAATALLALSACVTAPPPPPSKPDDLTTALRVAAQRAVDVRVKLAAVQPMSATPGQGTQSSPEIPTPATARIDIDYVGPVENASKLIARILGWTMTVNGKKRGDVIVSLRHEAQNAVTILQDIGVQCGNRCDIHVELVEGGKSSISLTYRD